MRPGSVIREQQDVLSAVKALTRRSAAPLAVGGCEAAGARWRRCSGDGGAHRSRLAESGGGARLARIRAGSGERCGLPERARLAAAGASEPSNRRVLPLRSRR